MTPNRLLAAFAPLVLAACARPIVFAPSPEPPPSEVRRGNSESVHVLGIPPGHLPRPGQCRVWVPGVPPGHQARARSCNGILATAPAGSWIVYRPEADVIHVHVIDRARAGTIVMVRYYNGEGAWLRDEEPGNHHDDEDDDDHRPGNGRGRRHKN